MPPKRRRDPPQHGPCSHPSLVLGVSSYAPQVKFSRPEPSKRKAAAIPSGRFSGDSRPKKKFGDEATTKLRRTPSPNAFPAPLVLPEDDLALDPQYPPQSLRSMIRDKDRNRVTPERKTIYIAAPPAIEEDVEFLNSWMKPKCKGSGNSFDREVGTLFSHLVGYLTAFFHGLPVKPYTEDLLFTSWTDSEKCEGDQSDGDASKSIKLLSSKYIALNSKRTSTRIQVRRSFSASPFTHQLNLNDLLDAAIDALPSDAYALLLLVNHDIYEDDEDDFACGRAYGGSRIAVVSSARYNPCLDTLISGLDRTHVWPASHCEIYLRSICGTSGSYEAADGAESNKRSEVLDVIGARTDSPMQLSLKAFNGETKPSWLYRVSRTASHELCHCLGMDHCVYYACIMQGTASMAEDLRQPPYLCPVDLEKLRRAVIEGNEKQADRPWLWERYHILAEFCRKISIDDGGRSGWASYEAWLNGILAE